MKRNARNIIKTVLLSATVALLHGTAKGDVKKTLARPQDPRPDGLGPETAKGEQPLVKNMYKILRSGDVKLIAGHRSHSSHRSSGGGHRSHSSSSSHRSHSSHRSSGGGSHYSHSSSSYGSSTRSTTRSTTSGGGGGGGSTSGTASYATQPVSPTYTLGSRAITAQTCGPDVDELVRLLKAAGYPPDPAKLVKQDGHYLMTPDITLAVKTFQAFNKIKPTGDVDAGTIARLKALDK